MLSSGPYDPHKTEKKWSEIWEKKKYFQAEPKSSKKPYCILMPPPNVTGGLHMGHAMQHTIMDILARAKRMQGFDVLLQPGVDHAGILFQGTLEKKLSKEKRVTRQRLGREKFLEECWKFKKETYDSISKTFRFMGISADWSREKFTLSPEMTNSVYTAFEKLWNEGLIYKGKYIVQWCPRCSTAIEDVETEYQEREDKLYYVKYFFADDKNNFITIATTRPETMFADVAVAVNPTDKRFKNLIGKKVILPLADREIPIIADAKVDKDFGTGALKITPAHDLLDYEIGARNNLEKLQVIDKQGKLTELAGEFQGLKSLEAREKVVEKLEKEKYLEKIEDYAHSVAVCERCKTTVEPIISEEWFVKTKPLAQEAIKAIKKNEIDFHPSRYGEILTDWLENIRDWCISRSLWWGHRMPVYYCQDCLPARNASPARSAASAADWQASKLACNDNISDGLACSRSDAGGENSRLPKGIIISKTKPEKCPVCGSKDLKQEEQVLDTWFSSWLWPISTLGWPEQTEEFKKYFPADFEISAPEIKYLWIARMVMSAKKFTGKIPFKNMFFHGTMRDLKGRKFSKSLGNGIEPMEMIEKWGTDSLRAVLASYSVAARDIWVSKNTMDERCKNFRNFNNKIWNASKFVLMNLDPSCHSELVSESIGSERKMNKQILKQVQDDKEDKKNAGDIRECRLRPDDIKILKHLNNLIKETTNDIENFKFHRALEKLYESFWHNFCDEYIETAKDRLKGDDEKSKTAAQQTLYYCLKTYLKLLHPFIPFITEEIWEKIPFIEKHITVSDWPKEIVL